MINECNSRGEKEEAYLLISTNRSREREREDRRVEGVSELLRLRGVRVKQTPGIVRVTFAWTNIISNDKYRLCK